MNYLKPLFIGRLLCATGVIFKPSQSPAIQSIIFIQGSSERLGYLPEATELVLIELDFKPRAKPGLKE